MSNEENAIISQHESNGNYVMVDGLKTFYLDAGISSAIFNA
jgi:hypothetical protein